MRYLRWLSGIMLVFGLAIVYAGSGADAALPVTAREQAIIQAAQSGELVRLHIIADSDQPEAQRIKLCVRDEFIARYADELSKTESCAQAIEWLSGELQNIEALADGVLEAQGATYTAHAETGVYDFPDRDYDGITVPAGSYQALRIMLGDGQGRNWWCVIYPDMCALAADTPAQAQGEADKIVLHSAIWEWLTDMFGGEQGGE